MASDGVRCQISPTFCQRTTYGYLFNQSVQKQRKHAKLAVNRLSNRVYFSVMWAKRSVICLLYPENRRQTEPNLRRHGKTFRTESDSEGLTANHRHLQLVSIPYGPSHLVPPLLYCTGRKGHQNILTVIILCKHFTYFD